MNSYQENCSFLLHSYSTRGEFLKQYNKLYNNKDKCKQLHIHILCELNNAVCNGNFKSFKNISQIFKYIIDTENIEELSLSLDEDTYSFQNTNLIILACEYNRLEILKYIFSNYTTIYESLYKNENRTISPRDEDKNHHNAFYYSIRAGNIELLEILISKWPGNYFESHSTELDEILSKVYEELKLKNVLLQDSMEIFIEEKLINLRFFSTSTNKTRNKISLYNINKRIDLVIEQINLLNSINEVNEEFLLILKFLAQNIFTLKRQLSMSYDSLPWEEIEFIIVCFISCNTTDNTINVMYRVVLNKVTIIKHLTNFANRLASVQDGIKTCKISWLSVLPTMSREQVIAQIIDKFPEFVKLYQDYHRIRDIYTLNVINDYVTLVLSIDVNSKEGQLTIIRSLQVIGECLKNTLESPKLSAHTSNFLFLSLPKSTRQLVVNLRNSLSHAYSLTKRTEILQNENIAFFEGIKNDIKKIGFVVKDIFYKNNLREAKSIFESIVSCKDTHELKEIVSLGNSFNMESLVQVFYSKENNLSDYEKINHIIVKLKNIISHQTESEKKILEKMEEVISLQNIQRSNTVEDYGILINHLNFSLQLFTHGLSIDSYSLKTLKYLCKTSLDNLNSSAVQPSDLKILNELLYELLKICYSKQDCDNLVEIEKLVLKIFFITDIQLGNIAWVSKLRDKLMECINNRCDTNKTFIKVKDKSENQLTLKLLELKKMITEYNLCKSTVNTILKNNRQVLAALEMLILEILSIVGDYHSRLETNLFFSDENIPLLIGKNLRNHLAHNNAIFDIMPSNLLFILIATAQNLIEKLDKNENKIGRSVTEDLEKLKIKIDLARNIISVKQKMFNALELGDFEMLRSCIAQGADVHARKNDAWTSLHAAAKGGNLDIVKFLIDRDVRTQVKSSDGKSPLHVAAEHGRVSIAEFFLQKEYYDVNCTDQSLKTPLHFAALNNHKVIVEILLKYNASSSAKDLPGCSPLHYAFSENHKDVAEILLKKEKNVDANEAKGGFTFLHVVSERGYLESVEYLLNQGANVHAKTDGNTTPLHLAASHGHTEVVKLLVAKKSDVNARVQTGYTPLYYAVENGHKIIADILLTNGANPNISDKTHGVTPLHCAAKDGHVDIVQALIYHKANINAVDVYDKTPSFYAILYGHLKILEIIDQHESTTRTVEFCLHLATLCGHVKIVDYLIGLNIDVNIKDNNDNTPLHGAAACGQKDIVALLLKNKAKINLKNKNGFTPLLCAVNLNGDSIDDINIPLKIRERLIAEDKSIAGYKLIPVVNNKNEKEKIVDILLQNGADIHVKSTGDVTVLHVAAASGNCSIVELLMSRNVPINSRSDIGITPLQIAAAFGRKEVVNVLIKNGADVNDTDKTGYTALHFACAIGSCDIVKILLAHNAQINATDKNNLTPLSLAVKENHLDVVEILIAHKSQIVQVNKIDVMITLCNNNNDILNILLRHNPVTKDGIKNNFSKEVSSLLHFAVRKCNEDIIRTLIRNGADVNLRLNNWTPIFSAIDMEREILIKILLENGADVNSKNVDGLTTLHVGVRKGNSDIIDILLDYGVDVNAKDNENRTALEFAVADGHLSIVKMLLPRVKMDINNKGNNDFTMLHIAAQVNEHLEVIQYLVANGADINSRNDAGSKPIHIAAREGHEETVKYFLSLGQDIDELGGMNNTPLHFCAPYSNVELARYLINKGANVNARSVVNRTPLHYASECRAKLDFVELLLEHGAAYNAVDSFGKKPISVSQDATTTNLLSSTDKLWQAVKTNNITEVKRSIKMGAFVNARNSDNMTPLHFAAWKGYDAIAAKLVNSKDIADVIGKKGLAPLHYAAKFGHLNVCKILLSAGAVYNVQGEICKTPLDLSDNVEISKLLKLVHSCFEMVSSKNVKVLRTLKNIQDYTVVKVIMNARNVDRKSLVAAAILQNFPKVDKLKQLFHEDLSGLITKAQELATYEQYDEALKIYKLIWKKRTELMGKNNPGSLEMQEMIATMLFKQQKYKKALDMYQEVYEKQKDLLSENSKEVLNLRSTIALVLHYQGKNKEALAIFEQVYEKQKNILTMNDRDFISTHVHMGLALSALGKFDEALQINTKIFEHQKKRLGSNHPETLVAQNNIAMVLNNQGQFDKAETMFRNVYELRKKILGPTHSDTLRALHNMVIALGHQKKYDEALKAYENVLEVQKRCLGSDDIDTLHTQLGLATFLLELGKVLKAYKIFNSCLPVLKRKLGPSHDKVRACEMMMEITRKALKDSGISNLIDIINNETVETRVAVSTGDLQTLQHMLESDVDVNETDEDGRTLLHFAADSGSVEVTTVLLNSGCTLTKASKKGNTPLHTATCKGHERIVEKFLNHVNRAELRDFVNAKTIDAGTTALHVAAKGGNYEIVKMLLKYGAVYSPKNNEGKTPLSLSQDQRVVRLLKLTDLCFKDVTKGNAEVIQKLREIEKDDVLAIINARNDQYKSIMQVAVVYKHQQIGKDLLMILKKAS